METLTAIPIFGAAGGFANVARRVICRVEGNAAADGAPLLSLFFVVFFYLIDFPQFFDVSLLADVKRGSSGLAQAHTCFMFSALSVKSLEVMICKPRAWHQAGNYGCGSGGFVKRVPKLLFVA